MTSTGKSYLDLLNEKNFKRRNKQLYKNEIARTREFLRKKEEDKRLALELALRLQKEKEEEERLERERIEQEAEIKRKTKAYYDINKYNRMVSDKDSTVYFGEYITTPSGVGTGKKAETSAWLPSGHGVYYLKDEVRYEGNYVKGKLHGISTFVEDDGTKWTGLFKNGMMDGIGVLTDKKGNIREVFMRNNLVVCDRAEIDIGKQVELYDADNAPGRASEYAPGLGYADPIRVVILSHVKQWTYRCRVQQEVSARERDINFATLASFKVLHSLPSIFYSYTKSNPDSPTRYDYFKDTYGDAGRPRLGIAGGRLDAELRGAVDCTPLPTISRRTSDHTENLFESAAVGLCVAIEAEKARLMKETQKQQMAEMLAKRRAQEAEAKRKRIAEEQERYLQEQMQKNVEARKLEQESFKQALAARVKKETALWTAKTDQMEERERLRRMQEKGIGGLFEMGQLVFSGLRIEGARDPSWKGAQNLYLKLFLDTSLSCRTDALPDDGAGGCVWGDVVVADGVSEEISIPVTATLLQSQPLMVQVWDAGSSAIRAKDTLIFEGSSNLAGLCDIRHDDVILELKSAMKRPKSRQHEAVYEDDSFPCRVFLAMQLVESEEGST